MQDQRDPNVCSFKRDSKQQSPNIDVKSDAIE